MVELNDQAGCARCGQQGQAGAPEPKRAPHNNRDDVHVRRCRPAGEAPNGEDDGVEAQAGPRGRA
eukprot:15044857-Alexandrium_andersonii.AAC.1